MVFCGEKFESVPALKLAKSLLLDTFRGLQVDHINLAGLDRVLVATAVDDTHLLLRQYVIKMKKSGTRIPRVALMEMGPRMDLVVRRHRLPPVDLEKEATKQPRLGKKKVRRGETGRMTDGRDYSQQSSTVIFCAVAACMHATHASGSCG